MKIAVVTNDGNSVSQHFGRSRYYKIYNIVDNKMKDVEMRLRGTGHFAGGGSHHSHAEENHHEPFGRHGFGDEAMHKHASMAREIADFDVLIAGGMGMGAYQHFSNAGLNVILTDKLNADEAVEAFLKGNLKNLYNERTD